MKIDKNLTEFENLLRLINANNPELKLRADQVKSVRVWGNMSGRYPEKNTGIDMEMVSGKGYSGSFEFFYDRVTIEGFLVNPEYTSPLPVLLSDTPETILARYVARYELASDTGVYCNYFVPPTVDQRFGSISVGAAGSSLLYHQSANVRLMRVDSLEDDLPMNLMVATSTLDGFETIRNQLEIN